MKVVIFISLLITLAFAWDIRKERGNDPRPNTAATVVVGNARFTVLTAQLIRLEWSEKGTFVDAASLVVINRNLPVPHFTTTTVGTVTTINTGSLVLSYDQGTNNNTFEQGTLNVTFSFNGATVNWYPGLNNAGNMNGTRISLDCAYSPNDTCFNGMPLDPGLISTNGWNVYDDSAVPLFDANVTGLPWIVSPSVRTTSVDWYFFGYGWNFKQLLFDYTQIAGAITIPPVSAFGSWWSRYWPYSEITITLEVIEGYKLHDLPLNHLVLDMDWHVEYPNDKQCNSWGGFTWNTDLFPDPPKFVDWLHGPHNELKLLLNIHHM